MSATTQILRCLPNFGRKLTRVFAADQRGTSAVEFAVIAPILITLLGGIVEFAHAFQIQAQMASTAQTAVRRLAMDAMTEGETKEFIFEQLPSLSETSLKVNIEEIELRSGRFDITVDLRVPVSEVTLFNMKGILDDDTLVLAASGTMVKE